MSKTVPTVKKTFRFSKMMAQKIRWLAQQKGTTDTEIVIHALELYLDDTIIRTAQIKMILDQGGR